MSSSIVNLTDALARLPPEPSHNLLAEIQQVLKMKNHKLIVLDDDPTGTQTVYNVPVLTQWSQKILEIELARDDVSTFFILTNSRSLPEAEAKALNQEIGRNLTQASMVAGVEFAVISRSDSTLRGHFPSEVEALTAKLGQEFDATLLIPFFLEGGRYTINNTHYVAEGDQLIPVADTSFAQDTVFGFRSSDLGHWISEKSHGRIPSSAVASISIQEMRRFGPPAVTRKLLALPPGSYCVINSASYGDLEILVAGLLSAENKGKRYMIRSAASFVRIRAGFAERPLLTPSELTVNQPMDTGGLIIAGSYVPKTTQQLSTLFAADDILPLEVNVANLLNEDACTYEIDHISRQAAHAVSERRDVAIFTSRQLVTGSHALNDLAIGKRVSESLTQIVRRIQTRPRFLIAKGGITSSDVATRGLGIQRAMVLGQVLPGIPVWFTGPESRYPNMPYIIFPGNVGGPETLKQVVKKLQNQSLP